MNLSEEEQMALAISESLKTAENQHVQDGRYYQGQGNFESPSYQRHHDYPNPSPMSSGCTKRELRLVFLGMTGAGKSSSANTVIGREEFKADCHGTSITYYCKHAKARVHGRDVLVVDTPGLFDTRQGNDDTMREITRCVCLSAPGPHALILVVQGGNRQTEQVQKCADIIMDVFGDQARRHMIILFTHRDDLEYHGQSLDGFIQTLPPKMREVLAKCGNRYLAFNNRYRSTAERDTQVNQLFAMVDKVISQNDGRCFTNDVYRDFENMIVTRERELKEKIEKQKEEELQKFQEKVEKESQRQLKVLEQQEREGAREREERERERERQYQLEREKEREREREREQNAWKMKQDEIERERKEFESREKEREEQRTREKEEEQERRQKEEQKQREMQNELEAKVNEQMMRKLEEQEQVYANRLDNLRDEVREEVQQDDGGVGGLIAKGLGFLGEGLGHAGEGLLAVGKGVACIGKGVGALALGVKSVWKSIFG